MCGGLTLLYAIGVFSRSIWFDEAITLQSLATVPFRGIAPGFHQIADLQVYLSGTTTIPKLIDHYISTDVHPPLYFLIAHVATLVFGNTLSVVRLVSLALVLASVVLYLRSAQHAGTANPWIHALIYGLSFAAMSTAQDARGYALVLLLGVAAWRVLTDIPETAGRSRVGRELLLGALCAGLLLTHYFALLLVIALLAWHMLDALFRRTPLALIAPVTCAVIFLPWLPVLVHHLGVRPDQMTGFHGLVEWGKRVANLIPGQVLSASHYAVPAGAQKIARLLVLALMLLGALSIIRRPGDTARKARFERIALFVPVVGISGFLAVSILLDRWFDTFRYYLFFAPFVTYLAARGVLAAGDGLASLGGAGLRLAPAALLIATQVAMFNFGWEANRNRGGEYYDTIAATLREAGVENSLAVIDMGAGRGTPLAAAEALPGDTRTYLLADDPDTWPAAAEEIAPRLESVQQVLLFFTIERGVMETDKTLLYAPLVSAIEEAGFVRTSAPPSDQGRLYYARWIKADGIG